MKGDLKPTRPQDSKEANVSQEVVYVGDGVVGCEGCQVGDKKQVEEEFDAIGLVPLGEDKILMISTDEGAFNKGRGFVQAFQVLFGVDIALVAVETPTHVERSSTHTRSRCRKIRTKKLGAKDAAGIEG